MDFSKVLILQLAILGVILESDLGRKKVGWFRIARPVIVAVAIVPIYFAGLPTSGNNLTLEVVGAGLGIFLGLLCVSPWFVTVEFDPEFRSRWARWRSQPGKPAAVSVSGARYATIWIVVSLARIAFAWGAQHAFPHALGVFMNEHRLAGDALTDALIFWPLGMDLFRSVGLLARGSAVLRRGAPRAQVSGA
jgi:hypothetical protein